MTDQCYAGCRHVTVHTSYNVHTLFGTLAILSPHTRLHTYFSKGNSKSELAKKTYTYKLKEQTKKKMSLTFLWTGHVVIDNDADPGSGRRRSTDFPAPGRLSTA